MTMIDPWSVGYNGAEDAAGQGRFLRPLTWVRQGTPTTTDTPARRRA
jgi:hypothetical protein